MLTCFAINLSYAQTEEETKIKQSELPESIKTELNAKYSKYTVNKIVKTQDEIKGTTYKVEVQKKIRYMPLFRMAKENKLTKARTSPLTKQKNQRNNSRVIMDIIINIK